MSVFDNCCRGEAAVTAVLVFAVIKTANNVTGYTRVRVYDTGFYFGMIAIEISGGAIVNK